jgi:hypothetical protein
MSKPKSRWVRVFREPVAVDAGNDGALTKELGQQSLDLP